MRLGCLKQPGGERRWEQTFYEAIAASTTCEEGQFVYYYFFLNPLSATSFIRFNENKLLEK